MPFYQMPSQAFLDAYVALARKHNDPATPDYEREILKWKGYGMLDAIRAEYGSVATGMVICHADTAIMKEQPDDAVMSGGFLTFPLAEPAHA